MCCNNLINCWHLFIFSPRDLSYTQISAMPYTRHLEGWLNVLDLRGTPNLHTFNSHRDGGILKGQSFLHLREATFNYHAHCCQLRRSNYSYYKPNLNTIGGKRETSSHWDIVQKVYDFFLGDPHSSESAVASNDHPNVRYTRQTIPDDNTSADSLVCLNYTDLNIMLFPTAMETPVTDATEEPIFICGCDGSQDCQDCVDFNCEIPDCTIYQSQCDCQRRRKRNAVDNSITGETNNSTADLPEGWFFHPNSTDLICTDNEIVNITAYVYRPCVDKGPSSVTLSHTVSAVLDISPTPTTLQTSTVPASSPFSTVAMAETSTPILIVTPSPCSSISEVFCTLTPEPPPPPTTSAPPCDCDNDFECEDCVNFGCEVGDCSAYQHICEGNCDSKRRRRYTTAIEEEARMKRDISNAFLPEGWFYPNPDNMSLACVLVDDTATTTTAVPTTSTTSLPPSTSGPRVLSCMTTLFPIDGRIPLLELSTVCLPMEDPFNPCEDLLGRGHALRSFIWIVIILALVGNSLVMIVFLGYTVITKRTKIELFVVHFFYFNLAVADFLMGIYLFTIAVQDLRTLGNFSMFDVAWRTEGGCDFAGFCAITSTMVSVYVLLVITVERLYTFSRALQNSHTSKTTAVILMVIGWGFGILMGLLPVITNDVNDYSKTAICLPFDVSSKLALSYVLFLLLFTGVVFTAIAICYIIIFYQVFYRQKTTISSVNDRRRWKTELKVALRMGTLVLTNFVCWFPIALLGVSAAVGNSLVNDITFAKWVMVFIFPINACLNPILYSILSKVFRDNLVLILGKCGLCGRQVSNIRRHRAGFTPSVTSNYSQTSGNPGLVSDSRRGTIMERFRNFSITSTTNLLGRRSSVMSQVSSEEHYQIDLMRAQRRRSSEYSSASSEDILGVKVNSRRGSAFSGGSMEEMTTFSNPGFRSSSPVGGSTVADGVAGNHKGSPHPRISLGAVPEENENFLSEIAVSSELSGAVDKQNPAYLENETGAADTLASEVDKHNNGNSPQIMNYPDRIIYSVEAEKKSTRLSSTTEGQYDSGVHYHVSTGSTDSMQSKDTNCYVHEAVSIEFD